MSEPAGPPDTRFGLRPRPVVDPVIAALIAEAALELWPRPQAVDPDAEAVYVGLDEQAERTWRFSGRRWASRGAPHTGRPWSRR